MATVKITIDLDAMEYVELEHVFRRRGSSSLKRKVAAALRRCDRARGVETSRNDWYAKGNERNH